MDHTENRFVQIDTYSTEPARNEPETAQVTQNRTLRGQSNPKIRSSSVTRTLDNSKSLQKGATGSRTTSSSRQAARSLSSATSSLRSSSSTVATGRKIESNGKVESNGTPSATSTTTRALIRRNSLGVPGERRDRVASRPASQNSKISTPKASVSSSEVRKPSSVNSTESKRSTLSSARPTARASPISATSPRLPGSRQAETLTRRTNQLVAKSATSSFGSAKRVTTPKSGEVTSKPTGEVTSKTRDNAARNKSPAASVARQPSPLLHAGRRKSLPVEGKEPSRPGAVPQVEAKANDDVRLDLRGQKVRSLDSNGLSLSPSLEFVYLRDNKLSSLVGIEVLKKVKVLDLSFNEFKGSGFEPLENCKFLQQLYLAGNQITSLNGLPELPNLEFLSVAQNKLKSLAMACQPRLQVLAASKNKISTLRSFPHLPMLEHLRLEENPILEMPHLEAAAIMLVGPTLKKFNDKDLSVDEQKLAKRYPAHTGLCIRDGWDLCPPEVASDSTLQFLLQKWKDHLPPGYILKKASIDSPFEEDACRCHFLFLKERGVSEESELTLKYQWFIAEKTAMDFEKIEGAVSEVYWPKHDDIDKYLKVECTPILGEVEYLPIFAVSSPVSPGTGCPKILSLRVEGDLVEGNIIRGFAEVAWCGGTPGKGVASWLRRRWNSSPVVIAGAEEEDYRLTLDDVDSSLVFMYTPVTEEGTKGEPQYAITDYVKAAFPSVTDVQIIGDLVEGKSIRGTGKYFGGKEGPSKFDWLREDNISGELLPVSSGAAEYLLTEDDVGCSLVFVYSPINLEGIEGKPSTAKATQISRAPPRVTQLKIMGDLREGNKITISAIVSGGLEGASRVQWFKMNSAGLPLNETAMEAISTSKIAKAFRIPLSAVGHFIVAKYTPVAQDGECGEAAFAVSEKRVETLPPSLNFLSITGEFKEGELLTASYGYIGGHEGSSEYSWYLHQEAEDPGALIPEAIGQLQYQVTKDAVYKFVSFKCIPVRNDGVVGEGRSAMSHERVQPDFPSILSLQILGECTEGSELYVEKKYWGGEEGESRIQWYLTSPDGIQHEINGAAGFSYIVCKEDIGSLISVSCEPIRKDGARGTIVFSEHVGPIMPGSPSCESLILHGQPIEGGCLSFSVVYSGGEKGSCLHEWVRRHSSGKSDKLSNNEVLDLTCEDVGSRIELVFTPVRKDGFVGTSQKVVSEVIKDAEPEGIDLIIPHCCEDKEVIPQKSYYGGIEGGGQYTWFRVQSELSNSALLEELNNMTDVKILAKSRTYIPNLEDVGFYLALQWVPARKDGKQGKPLITMSQLPVAAAHPTVRNVCIEEISPGLYAGKGDYYGGIEGNSERSWYREKEDGTMVLINGANTDLYQVVDDDYTCRIFFGYLPVRSDGIEGDLCLSEPSNVILPEPPKVQKLVLTGKAVEGEILTAVEVMPNSELQQIIWEKYRKDIKYHWYRSSFPDDSGSFEPLLLHRSGSYKVRLEDVGFELRCECILTDTFGRTSEPVSVTVGPVSAGIPKVEKLEIEGRGYHTNLYAVRGIYSGGKEGKSKIQWLRSMVGSPDLISIPGEVGRMYEANVDDVGYRLVAIYTPVRDDGIEGTPVSTSTEPIAVEPEVLKEVKQKLDLGAVKFEALRDRDRTLVKSQTQGLGSLERRILEVNRKRLKVIKPGSKTSFPTTEIRGTYAPPFHVELFRNDQHRLKIVIDGETEVDLMVQSRHLRDVIVLVIRGLAQRFNSTSLNSLLKM